MSPTPRTVAHLNDAFFEFSETFIYHYVHCLSHRRAFRPVCLGWAAKNLGQFPFPSEDFHSLALPWKPADRAYRHLVFRLSLRNRFAEWRARRICRRLSAALLHAHFGPVGFFSLPLREALGVPLVTTFYGYDMSQLPAQPAWRDRFRRLFQNGDLFLVEGEYMRRRLQGLGCPAEKIKIQRIAVPLGRLAFRARTAKPKGDSTVILFCGRFVEKKGLLVALRALAKIRARNGRFEFRIIGDGPQRSAVAAFVRDNAMADYVRMLGSLDYDRYLRELEDADIFLQPSLTAADGDSEGGAPTTLLEAQALGLPIVTTTHADIPNVVVPGRSALLAPEGDEESLASLILGLMDRPEAWAAMGRAGRAFVETYHDIDKEAGALESKYRELIEA